MTTSILHTPEQEVAIRYFRKKYNAQHGTSFTNGQYADFRVKDLFDHLIELMNAERSSEELLAAFKAANPTQQAAVRTALNITEP